MTRLQIANTAINLLGSVELVTWGESTINGNLAALHLPFALKQVLSESPWEGTIQVLQLESSDETESIYGDMIYAYDLPGDLFRIFEVNGIKTGWKMIDGILHTNEPTPDILYSVEPPVDDVPDEVGHLAAFLLAFYMAPSITQDPNKPTQMLQQYSIILSNEKTRTEQQLGELEEYDEWWTD